MSIRSVLFKSRLATCRGLEVECGVVVLDAGGRTSATRQRAGMFEYPKSIVLTRARRRTTRHVCSLSTLEITSCDMFGTLRGRTRPESMAGGHKDTAKVLLDLLHTLRDAKEGVVSPSKSPFSKSLRSRHNGLFSPSRESGVDTGQCGYLYMSGSVRATYHRNYMTGFHAWKEVKNNC